MLYQLGFIYRRPTYPNYCSILCSQRAADFNPRAISLTLEVIYHGRCIPELMQFVNKDFFGKSVCSFASKTDGADREIYEVSFSREFKVVLYGYNAASSRHGCLEQLLRKTGNAMSDSTLD